MRPVIILEKTTLVKTGLPLNAALHARGHAVGARQRVLRIAVDKIVR
jgi:hypothetical protein